MDKPVVSTMVKKVNIHAPIPIRTVTPNLYGDYKNLMMSPANILKCIIHRATVHEVLSDGSLVKLTNKNYNLNNEPEKVPAPKEDKLQSAVVGEEKTKDKIVKEKVADKVKPAEKPQEEKVVETPVADEVKENLATVVTPEGEEEVKVEPGKVIDPPAEIKKTEEKAPADDKKEDTKEPTPTYKPKKSGNKKS